MNQLLSEDMWKQQCHLYYVITKRHVHDDKDNVPLCANLLYLTNMPFEFLEFRRVAMKWIHTKKHALFKEFLGSTFLVKKAINIGKTAGFWTLKNILVLYRFFLFEDCTSRYKGENGKKPWETKFANFNSIHRKVYWKTNN